MGLYVTLCHSEELIANMQVIKVLSMASEAEITEADRGTVTILSTIKTVEKQINSLTSQIDQYVYTFSVLPLPSLSIYILSYLVRHRLPCPIYEP